MHDKREQILEAALTVFSCKGFHNARMIEIARQAGVGKGTVYEYFASKSDLFYQMAEREATRYLREIRRHIETQSGFTARLEGLIIFHKEYISRRTELSACVNNGSIVMDEALKSKVMMMMRQTRGSAVQMIEDILEQGRREGCVSQNAEISFAANIMLNMVMAYSLKCVQGEEEPPEKLIRLITDGIGA